MGEAKQKENRRQAFLKMNPFCIYCGGPATTTDHCPPRCFFDSRVWPEGYEFPACQPCNQAARLDEQIMAVLVRMKLTKTGKDADRIAWEKLALGLKNNQCAIVAEWTSLTRNENRRAIREAFGRDGDSLRSQGWSTINLGPLTQAAIQRFMIKLSKALYYLHNKAIFDGVLYLYHVNVQGKDGAPTYLNEILKMAPSLPSIQRNSKPLLDQFIYRFNHSEEHGVMYAVIQLSDEFIFQVIALSKKMESDLLALSGTPELSDVGRHECFLTV